MENHNLLFSFLLFTIKSQFNDVIYYKTLTKNNTTFIIHLFLKVFKLLYVFLKISKDNIQVKLSKDIFSF